MVKHAAVRFEEVGSNPTLSAPDVYIYYFFTNIPLTEIQVHAKNVFGFESNLV